MPFIRRALADYALTEIAGETTDYAVMISTTDVYAVAGVAVSTNWWLAGDSDACRAEAAFIEECRARGLAPTLLRCGHIVGTGMNGLPRRMAESIYRGVFVDIKVMRPVRVLSMPLTSGRLSLLRLAQARRLT